MREETHCHPMGYSFRLAARVLLYAPSHRQDSTYHGLCYSSRGALAGTRNSSMGPPHEGSISLPDLKEEGTRSDSEADVFISLMEINLWSKPTIHLTEEQRAWTLGLSKQLDWHKMSSLINYPMWVLILSTVN